MSAPPEPCLQYLDNQTGLTVFQYDKMGPGRQFHDVVVVKGSFDIQTGGVLANPVRGKLSLADTHRNPDDPLGSSLAEAGDLILGKPGADIYVTGTAVSAYPRKQWSVEVSVLGPQHTALVQYRCVATGPRRWRHSREHGWHLGDPDETAAVPILYELAWGGRARDADNPPEQWESCGINPSGSGYSFQGYSLDDQPAGPQWGTENATSRSVIQELTGLGPVARFWDSRKHYAGTYDAAWRERFDAGEPDYPTDFDPRFFQCAHPALQITQALKGDEQLRLTGLLPVDAAVPVVLPNWRIRASTDRSKFQLPLDTLHIDLDTRQLHLTWRLTLPQTRRIKRVLLSLEKS